MLKFYKFAFRPFLLYSNTFSYKMQPPKPTIKYINWKVDTFGDYPEIKSTFRSDRSWTLLKNVNQNIQEKYVMVRARVHFNTLKGKICFLQLRQGFYTLQACIFKNQNITKQMIQYIGNIPPQSVIDVYGKVVKPQKPIQSCSQQVQIQIQKCFVVNRSMPRLPLQITDASRKVITNQEFQSQQPTVNMKTRLDNRVLDLRTSAKHGIFRLTSGLCQLFREFLLERDFVEIHTPKLIAGSSQGGANVFKLDYFNRKACLAQSPQLYKQMCVQGDFQRVFQIGPVFRAQNAFTHRHMCEYVGLDVQMEIKQHYMELLQFFGELFPFIFEGLQKRFAKQLNAISEQFQFQPFKCKTPVVKLTFEEGVALLKENGVEWNVEDDLDTPTEKKLGELVRKKYETDFYMLHRYPVSARPFYTTICEDDPRFTCSYDFFMRGQQILSGAQRIHDPQILQKRAIECGIDPKTIESYIDCFRYGAFPHGGGGIGMQRIIMLYCGLKNIRNASLFPRDPRRITP